MDIKVGSMSFVSTKFNLGEITWDLHSSFCGCEQNGLYRNILNGVWRCQKRILSEGILWKLRNFDETGDRSHEDVETSKLVVLNNIYKSIISNLKNVFQRFNFSLPKTSVIVLLFNIIHFPSIRETSSHTFDSGILHIS